jgi:hypothetical protein
MVDAGVNKARTNAACEDFFASTLSISEGGGGNPLKINKKKATFYYPD